MDGDLILYVAAVHMKEKGELKNNAVATTIMSNLGLYKAFEEADIAYEKTDVGDKFVYECMKNNDYRLGGEQSGHIIFSKYATTGDGVLTSIKLMEFMLTAKKKMSELIAPVTIYPQYLENVRVEDKDVVLNDEDVLAAAKKVEEDLEGDGRIILRASGTEPVVRVMAEAKTDELSQKVVKEVVEVIKSKGYEA